MIFKRTYRVLLLLLLSIITFCVKAQSQKEVFIKSSYIINFIEEIRWENEKEITTFKVGVLDAPLIYDNLKELTQNVSIRNKTIQVINFNSLKDVDRVDLLYISPSYSKKNFNQFGFLGDKCLLVSDNGDGLTQMINFYIDKGSVKFTLNLKQLKSKGFESSLKLLVYGGYSDEVLSVFYESEEALKQEKIALKKRDKEIKEKELHIYQLAQDIKDKEADIQSLKKGIMDSKLKISDQENLQSELNIRLIEQQKVIKKYNREIAGFAALNKSTYANLNDLHEQLILKKQEIQTNNQTLKKQQEKLTTQELRIIDKDGKLKTSIFLFVIVFILFLLFIFLFYNFYKANKAKKNAFDIIEEKNEEILKASAHKDEFLANMSHEIRTPLNAIVGFTNILISRNKNIEDKEYLSKVLLSSNNLLKIINEILDISKIEAGNIDVEEVSFDVKNIVTNAFDSIAHITDETNFEYNLIISENVPQYIKGDQTKITQIIINLLGNAIKFTERGKVELEIKVAQYKFTVDGVIKNIEYLKFIFSDTGIGIAASEQQAIFEKFKQENTSITRKHGGTGLGLPITKKLIDILGGEITLESKVGIGSVLP